MTTPWRDLWRDWWLDRRTWLGTAVAALITVAVLTALVGGFAWVVVSISHRPITVYPCPEFGHVG